MKKNWAVRWLLCCCALPVCRWVSQVWTGISYDGSLDLYIIRNGFLIGFLYRNEFLAPNVRPYARAIVNNFIFMGNARPYRAGVVHQLLEEKTIVRMCCSAKSRDPNPIRYAWTTANQLNTICDFEIALVEECSRILKGNLQNFNNSFQNKCREVIRDRSGHTINGNKSNQKKNIYRWPCFVEYTSTRKNDKVQLAFAITNRCRLLHVNLINLS